MDRFRVLSSGREANMMVSFLKSHGLNPVLSGNKEYASIITGADAGRFEVLLPADEFERAKELLKDIAPEEPTNSVAERIFPKSSIKPNVGHHLKKSIIFAVMGIAVLPVIFNYFSITSLIRYYKEAPNSFGKWLGVTVSVVLNLAMIVTYYYTYTSYTDPNSEFGRLLRMDDLRELMDATNPDF